MGKKSNNIIKITRYLPVLIILLSITVIVGSTFAYFTDRKEDTSNLTFSKVELSSETTTGVNGTIRDVIPGTKLVDGALEFSKAIDSEAIYVRAKISFSLPEEYADDEDMKTLLDNLRGSTDFNIVATEQNGAVWSAKDGNYFYLLNADDTNKLMRVDTIDTYVLSNEVVVPRDLESLEDNAQYMKSINFHIAFEAIQADNVSNILSETKVIFNQLYPSVENERIYYLIVQNNNNNNNNDTILTKVEVGTVIQEPIVEKDGYIFDGWYSKDGSESGDWGEKYTFPILASSNISLFAKWKEETVSILAVRQNNVGNNSTLTKVGDNALLNLSKNENLYTEDEYYTNAPIYKDIEIRALEVGTDNVVAILDKDNNEENNNSENKIVTATEFPWSGTYGNMEVDIYTFYPEHYISYVPYSNDNGPVFYLIVSDKNIENKSIEIEEGVSLDIDPMYVKHIQSYYRATFESVYYNNGNYLNSFNGSYTSNILNYSIRSVAQQFVGTYGYIGDYRQIANNMSTVSVNVKYNIDDYHNMDYQALYLIKYANYDCQEIVGPGISAHYELPNFSGQYIQPVQVTNLSTYTSATAEGWGCTPTISNCQSVNGRDGYIGNKHMTPVWCLGVANPWGNMWEMQEGLYTCGEFYYTEDDTKYTSNMSQVKSTYKKYKGVKASMDAFKSTYDIYGVEDGQTDNPLLAMVFNCNYTDDALLIFPGTSELYLFWRSGVAHQINCGVLIMQGSDIGHTEEYTTARLVFVA